MILPNLKHPVYRKARQLTDTHAQLKEFLVVLGVRALAHGDMARVALITELLSNRRFWHV